MVDALPRWLITGASGFLGANMAMALRGHALRIGGVRAGRPAPALFDEVVPLDLTSSSSIDEAVARSTPDVILHAGALSSHEACEADPDLAFAVNGAATGRLAEVAAATGAYLIAISTDAVFDGRTGHYRETDVPSPFSVYGHSKAEGEREALATGQALVVRTNFFGWSPSGRRSILEYFVTELTARRPVRGFTDFTVTSLYAQDLAHTLIELTTLSHRTTGLLHLTSSDALSKFDFAQCVASEFGLDGSLITASRADVTPPRNRDISLDTSLVASILGRSMPSQLAGIRDAASDFDLRIEIRASGAP